MMNNYRALVTGGAGFIGSHLSKQLLEQGREVVVYDNFFTGKREFLPHHNGRLKIIEGDLLDNQYLKKIFKEFKPAVVFHLAAIHYIPYCNENPVETIMVNVGGTEAILDACREIELEKLIFASSAAVYPINDKPNLEEDDIVPCDIYGNSKFFGEYLGRLFYENSSTPCIIARLFNVYGPDETNPHVVPDILEQLKKDSTIQLGNLTPKRDYIYVQDVVDALISIEQKTQQNFEIFNVGTGQEYSVKELVETIEQIVCREINIEQAESRKRKSDRLHLVADVSKISKMVGWKPKYTLSIGLKSLIEIEYNDLIKRNG